MIIEGSVETAIEELAKHGSFRVVVKTLIYAKFDEPQNIPSIIAGAKSDEFKLVSYRDRKQFRARKYLQ